MLLCLVSQERGAIQNDSKAWRESVMVSFQWMLGDTSEARNKKICEIINEAK